MFTAIAQVQVQRPIAKVFEFVEDARNRPLWDDTVISEEITSALPITVGTTVRTRLRSMGREYAYTWVVVDHRAPERMTIESVTGPLPTTLEFTLTGDDSQTLVGFTVTGRPTGIMRLMQPIIARTAQRNLARNFEALGRLLEGDVSSVVD